MTYERALEAAKNIGASKVKGLPHLAVTIEALALAHAINPKLVYEGAVKQGLTASQVRKLDAVALGDLMFL